jgi:hypothetical protein
MEKEEAANSGLLWFIEKMEEKNKIENSIRKSATVYVFGSQKWSIL